MQAQTEPKLHPETANMEFDQVITKRSATLKGDLKVNLGPKWFLRRFGWKFHISDFRATLLFTSFCAHVLITIQVPGLWWGKWGKNWNQNTPKKWSWLIFGYVLGSVFVAQPSKVSRNRQKTWQRREKKQATWKDNKYQQTKKEMAAVRVWGRSPWERYKGDLDFQLLGYGGGRKVPMLDAMLASMLGSSCQAEATMEKRPVGFHVGFHVGSAFQDMDRVLQADLPLLGRSPRAVASPIESTWNLTWTPVSVPVALTPGGPARSLSCWVEVLEPLRLLLGQRETYLGPR